MPTMGRKRTVNLNLPIRMKARKRPSGTYYYYFTGTKEIPLGKDYVEAVRQWAVLEGGNARGPEIMFRRIAEQYMREVLPTKAPRTQKDNLAELANLLKFFDNPPAPIDQIRPIHIRQYLDWRGASAKVRANREKALFSHIYNKAREWGYTDRDNPCRGVQGFTETGRDVYISDEHYCLLWWYASAPVRDAIDLAYLAGQRPSDTLKMAETDIRDCALNVRQGKTNTKLRVAITGDLSTVIDRIKARKAAHQVRALALVVDEQGKKLSMSALIGRWEHIRENAAKHLEQAGDPAGAAEVRGIQYRDMRAKAGTDKEESEGMAAAKDLLGHAGEGMTAQYVRHRRGKLVGPTR